jgi:hypothetical protein
MAADLWSILESIQAKVSANESLSKRFIISSIELPVSVRETWQLFSRQDRQKRSNVGKSLGHETLRDWRKWGESAENVSSSCESKYLWVLSLRPEEQN